MSTAEPTPEWNAYSDAGAADIRAQPSKQEVLKWVLLGLLVIGGLIMLAWWLLIVFPLAILLWFPAVLLAGVLVAAVWRWS